MKFTLNWLKEHLSTEASLEEICDKLTMLGLEVEEVIDNTKALEGYVVAKILEAHPHPNANKLKVLKVYDGKQEYQVVCGAPNARANLIGIFGRIGLTIPNGQSKLKLSKIRDVESFGMMMSERELNISDEHDGIIELNNKNLKIGSPASIALDLDDPIIDIAITPNRGDCLGVRYIAQDLAAAQLGELKPFYQLKYKNTGDENNIQAIIEEETFKSNACQQFIGIHIKNVNNSSSPRWLQKKLEAIGVSVISSLVDITNYVSYDLCRPLHVFDSDKLQGNLTIKKLKENTTVLGLDDIEYQVPTGTLVICDEEKIVSIAGVMGLKNSAVDENTTNVYLEVAVFDNIEIAKSGRNLGIISDARQRFERGIDIGATKQYAQRAVDLILTICGGSASKMSIAGEETFPKRKLSYNTIKFTKISGFELNISEQKNYLQRIGCIISESENPNTKVLEIEIPTWRYDIHTEACLVEEILRLHGYDHIPELKLSRIGLPQPATDLQQERAFKASRLLASRGLNETITYSFYSEKLAKIFSNYNPSLKLINPISSELSIMRGNLIANLVDALKKNTAHSIHDGAIFEVGPQFDGLNYDEQPIIVAGARIGNYNKKHWTQQQQHVNLFHAKTDALLLLEGLNFNIDSLQIQNTSKSYYHPNRSGSLCLGNNVLAYFGEIHPRVLQNMNIKQRIVAFEVLLENIPTPKKKISMRPSPNISKFPNLERDFAFVINKEEKVENLIKAIRLSNKELISNVDIFDVFEHENIGKNNKSVAVKVIIKQKITLTNKEIESISQQIIENAHKKVNATLR